MQATAARSAAIFGGLGTATLTYHHPWLERRTWQIRDAQRPYPPRTTARRAPRPNKNPPISNPDPPHNIQGISGASPYHSQPITNHLSTRLTLAQGGPFTFHLSPFTFH